MANSHEAVICAIRLRPASIRQAVPWTRQIPKLEQGARSPYTMRSPVVIGWSSHVGAVHDALAFPSHCLTSTHFFPLPRLLPRYLVFSDFNCAVLPGVFLSPLPNPTGHISRPLLITGHHFGHSPLPRHYVFSSAGHFIPSPPLSVHPLPESDRFAKRRTPKLPHSSRRDPFSLFPSYSQFLRAVLHCPSPSILLPAHIDTDFTTSVVPAFRQTAPLLSNFVLKPPSGYSHQLRQCPTTKTSEGDTRRSPAETNMMMAMM